MAKIAEYTLSLGEIVNRQIEDHPDEMDAFTEAAQEMATEKNRIEIDGYCICCADGFFGFHSLWCGSRTRSLEEVMMKIMLAHGYRARLSVEETKEYADRKLTKLNSGRALASGVDFGIGDLKLLLSPRITGQQINPSHSVLFFLREGDNLLFVCDDFVGVFPIPDKSAD